MMLCNCDPDDPLHVIGFVAGGIRQGISAPLFVVAGAALHCYVCDFLLLLCVPFVLLRRFPSRSSVRPPVSQSVKLPSSMIAVNCFPFAIVCLSLSLHFYVCHLPQPPVARNHSVAADPLLPALGQEVEETDSRRQKG